MEEQILTSTRFDELSLPEALVQALSAAGFEYLTPIQKACLEPMLAGKDIAGQARTGSGKTLTFLLQICVRLLTHEASHPGQPRALVIAPTRELVIQIHRDLEKLLPHLPLKAALAYGGVDYEKQRKTIEQGCDILIGTPGRLIDYFKQGVYKLKHMEVVVLDEADRMFDLGFIKDIRYMLRRLPPPEERQSMLFSATLGYRVTELAYEHMNEPELIQTGELDQPPEQIQQWVYYPAMDEKIALLVGLLRETQAFRSIVFVNTKRVANLLKRWLDANGFKTAVLSGDIPQKKRQSMLKRFADGELDIMVATDVAARGLHIPDVSHVFNYDLPHDVEDYIHRIGRTGRLGAEGVAISFACEDYAFVLPDIEERLGHALEVQPIEDSMLAELKRPPPEKRRSGPPRRGGGRSGGQRGGGRGPRRNHD